MKTTKLQQDQAKINLQIVEETMRLLEIERDAIYQTVSGRNSIKEKLSDLRDERARLTRLIVGDKKLRAVEASIENAVNSNDDESEN